VSSRERAVLVKMASLRMLRVSLLVFFSVFLTLVLGFGLPSVLNLCARACGFPETSVTECIVLVYALFVLYVAMPRLPRGTLTVQYTTLHYSTGKLTLESMLLLLWCVI